MEIARVCTKQKALNILEFVKKYLKIPKSSCFSLWMLSEIV
jgi:hypothetical protein